jgi:acetyl esterase
MDFGKYARLLDPEYRAYAERVNDWYPPESTGWSIAHQREVYDEMCLAFHAGRPSSVEVDEMVAQARGLSVDVRRYVCAGARSGAVVLYFHGGGFVLGGLDSHDDICAEICDATGLIVVSVDYRLAPEHLHPAAFEDACAAFEWVSTTFGGPVVLCGESAGGNLAAALAHVTRQTVRVPVGQVLIYPDLGGDPNLRSRLEHAAAPLLSVRDLEYYRAVRTGGVEPCDDWRLEPLKDSDFSNLPSTVVVAAACDPLSSDGEDYCGRILAAGGSALWREEPRLTHSFLRARHTVARAGDAFRAILADITALAAGNLSISRR